MRDGHNPLSRTWKTLPRQVQGTWLLGYVVSRGVGITSLRPVRADSTQVRQCHVFLLVPFPLFHSPASCLLSLRRIPHSVTHAVFFPSLPHSPCVIVMAFFRQLPKNTHDIRGQVPRERMSVIPLVSPASLQCMYRRSTSSSSSFVLRVY